LIPVIGIFCTTPLLLITCPVKAAKPAFEISKEKGQKVGEIQKLIDKAERSGIRELFIPRGHYLLERALVIPSDFTLRLDKDAYIELKKGANDYLLRNRDLEKGNSNIKVIGGKWNGNGWSQKRQLKNTVADSKFCFGLFFYRVKNLEVALMEIDSTRSWGVAYMECDSVYIHDIHLQQNPFIDKKLTSALNENGDGVTGGGNNVLIENISGFTNDDLVAFASGGASFKGEMAAFPAVDYENVVVRNIYPQNSHDSIPSLKGVAFYTFRQTKITNIYIDGVQGNTAAASVLFYSLLGQKGTFNRVRIKNVKGTNVYSRSSQLSLPLAYGIITVKNSRMDSLYIENVERHETRYVNPTFVMDAQTSIGHLSIQKVHISHSHLKGNFFIDAREAHIKSTQITDIEINSD